MHTLLTLVVIFSLIATVMCEDAASGKGISSLIKTAAGGISSVIETASGKTQVRKVRSLMQACRKDISSVCKANKDIMQCLEDGVESITDDTCKSWVQARKTCLAATRSSEQCSNKKTSNNDDPLFGRWVHTQLCMLTMTPEDLGSECVSSDYYKSISMVMAFRNRPSRRPKKSD